MRPSGPGGWGGASPGIKLARRARQLGQSWKPVRGSMYWLEDSRIFATLPGYFSRNSGRLVWRASRDDIFDGSARGSLSQGPATGTKSCSTGKRWPRPPPVHRMSVGNAALGPGLGRPVVCSTIQRPGHVDEVLVLGGAGSAVGAFGSRNAGPAHRSSWNRSPGGRLPRAPGRHGLSEAGAGDASGHCRSKRSAVFVKAGGPATAGLKNLRDVQISSTDVEQVARSRAPSGKPIEGGCGT